MILRCLCLTCRGEELLPERMGEGHTGVRFGDRGPEWSVLLNGKEVAGQAFEAMAGRNGWVALYHEADGRRHVCWECTRAVCAYVKRGVVSVSCRPRVHPG